MSRSSASSDDEAPEAVSFAASRKSAQEDKAALTKFHAEEKQKLKEKRRAKDKALKERKAQNDTATLGNIERDASHTKEKTKAAEDSDEDATGSDDEEDGEEARSDLAARMERAMRQAAQEEDSEGEGGGEDESDVEDEEQGDESGEDVSDSEVDLDDAAHAQQEEDSSDEDEDDHPPEPPFKKAKLSRSPNYLPDHLFASALSEAAHAVSTSKSKAESTGEKANTKPRKRKRASKAMKDLVVGSRTIRTLTSSTQTPKTFAPPRSLSKFVDRTLNMRGSEAGAKSKGWERRAANVGVMKRNGPAAQFVRS